MVGLWTAFAVLVMFRTVAAAGLQGCEVRLRPHVMDTDPSYMTWTPDPTVTPVVNTYMALVDIDVQVTGGQGLQVKPNFLPISVFYQGHGH
jgi:hypothetical protein